MGLSKSAPKGMRDILPADVAIREKVLSIIKDTYAKFGFSQIETPCVEDINLLTSKQGGDNEKLIFKILKRGDKLDNADDGQLCDLGLRYDLTVPLSRYYANNIGQLNMVGNVFKSMQIGNVWRAERPQKGRFRQFTQCDIDIIGEQSNLAEIELISATVTALSNLGFNGFTVRINDRRLLKAIAAFCGFEDCDSEKVFIALDKLDKIGLDKVIEEISAFATTLACDKLRVLMGELSNCDSKFERCVSMLGQYLDQSVADNLQAIIQSTNKLTGSDVVFDATLVRGMNYYTGAIFEVSLQGSDSSVAGGGRYDEMLGKLTGKNVSACGFSIGFERIVSLVNADNIIDGKSDMVAYILEKDISSKRLTEVLQIANETRKTSVCQVAKKISNFGFMLTNLRQQGYDKIYLVNEQDMRLVD